jgi:hypothetical protein
MPVCHLPCSHWHMVSQTAGPQCLAMFLGFLSQSIFNLAPSNGSPVS